MNKEKKHLVILGSTGSIGQSALRVIENLKNSFKVEALVARQNIDLLEIQALKFNPSLVAVYDKKKAFELSKRIPHIKVVGGVEGVLEAAAISSASLCLSALSGTSGILPTIRAIESGKDIALANKEALVSAGALIRSLSEKKKCKIIPIDSEQSAIFQCLHSQKLSCVERLILTASGGPFLSWSKLDFHKITVQQALNHPTWTMGVKNTIDSSTLMNKGLEVIEARWLFNIAPDKIDIVVHPQSLVHSFVEFIDGSLLAQISENNMMIPIQYALTYPNREKGSSHRFDFKKYAHFDFFEPDIDKFLCLKLALHALKVGDSLPCFMNAANEILVERFIEGEISWLDIGMKLEKLMQAHHVVKMTDVEAVQFIDMEGREKALCI